MEKKQRKSLLYLKHLIPIVQSEVFYFTIYGLWIALLSLAIPLTTQVIVNTLGFGLVAQPIFFLALLLMSILGLSATIEVLRTWLSEKIQSKIFTNDALKIALKIHFLGKDLSFQNRRTELVNKNFSLMIIHKALSFLLLDGIAIGIKLFTGLFLLSVYHPFMMVLTLLVTVVFYVFIFRMVGAGESYGSKETKLQFDIHNWFYETSTCPNLLMLLEADQKTENKKSFFMDRINEKLLNYLDCKKKLIHVLLMHTAGLGVLEILCHTTLLIGGGLLVTNQQLTLGQLIAAEIILSDIIYESKKIVKLLNTYYDFIGGCHEIEDFYQAAEIRSKGLEDKKYFDENKVLPESLENITFSTLTHKKIFHWSHNAKKFYLGVQVKNIFQAKEFLYFLCGRSFSSEYEHKSTLHKNHLVLLNDIQEAYYSQTLKDQWFLYYEKPEFFQGSLLENLMIFTENTHASFQQMNSFLKTLRLEAWVSQLQNNLKASICSDSTWIPDAYKRNLCVARMLMSSAKVLLFENLELNPKKMEDRYLIELLKSHHDDKLYVFTGYSSDELIFCDEILNISDVGTPAL